MVKTYVVKPNIILASGSKARSQILLQCGIPHKVIISRAKEIINPKKSPEYNTLLNASRKAEAVAKNLKSGFIVAADTLVLSDRHLIGKPKDKLQAKKLLKNFSGRTISVYTGLCIKDVPKNKSVKAVAVSKVKVKKLNSKEINGFLKLLGPFDKAGGFSIEGAGSFIFDNIEGSFYNILGLPTVTLYELFRKLGVNLLKFVTKCDN